MTRAYPDATDVDARLESLREQNMLLSRVISELRNQEALKTQFLANISHDLRTPLTAIITHAEILRDGMLGPLTSRQAESVTGIIGGGRQLLEMVGEILTYARGAADQLSLTRSEFALDEVIEQVCAMSESLVNRKAQTLTSEVPPDLPTLFADREKVAHVLANLLGNAIDFTPPGGRVWVNARLTHAAESDGGAGGPAAPSGKTSGSGAAIEIEVGDTGIGIAPEHHDLVFREFAQVDASASRLHHGTGLGLAIARKFVELHHGRIWVDSALGRGSRFYFTIPLRGTA